jgi:hypothetical protein
MLAMMSDSRKRDLRGTETKNLGKVSSLPDKISIFTHWKAAESLVQATRMVLSIAHSYDDFELHSNAILILREGLELWNIDLFDGNNTVACALQATDIIELPRVELELLIQLLFALTRTLAMMGRIAESFSAHVSAGNHFLSTCCRYFLSTRSPTKALAIISLFGV